MTDLHTDPSFVVSAVVFLGVAAQNLAHRLRLPSILLLLLFGFLVSPAGFNLFNPAELIGDKALFPLISVAVAVILFEGGLTLKLPELQEIRRPLQLLITVGSIVTWLLTAVASYYILGFGFKLSLLVGAILIVTGPTVIGPLLRHVRPTGRVASIVKWEGILNDPIGALIAVLVLEIILHSSAGSALSIVTGGLGLTLVVGTGLGVLGAYLLIFSLRNHWIPITCRASPALPWFSPVLSRVMRFSMRPASSRSL
jgi:NhaP-type Na+/H+ or K+/H+ antiporter